MTSPKPVDLLNEFIQIAVYKYTKISSFSALIANYLKKKKENDPIYLSANNNKIPRKKLNQGS